MKWKIAAAVGMLAVGIGAVAIVVMPPASGGSTTSQFTTAQATRTDVVSDAVATGTIQAVATYGLQFGADPQLVASGSTDTGSGNSTTTWTVTAVSASVGQAVKAGDVLATADTTDAEQELVLAKAQLAEAQERLETDKTGLTAAERASAKDSVRQANLSVTNALRNQSTTRNQNSLSVSQASAALSRANSQYATDKRWSTSSQQIAASKSAVTSARDALARARSQAAGSNASAAQQVASARLQLTAAQNSYKVKVAPVGDSQIASDEIAVMTAQKSVDAAQKSLDGAKIVAPLDGTVVAVAIQVGVAAPSGYAFEVQSAAMEVVADYAESDIGSLKVGQDATITITATNSTVTGKVSRITPVASSSGGNSSVVTFEVAVALTSAPAGTLSGMTAAAAVTLAQAKNVIAVPAIALLGSNGNYVVRVEGADGSVESRQVDVGLVTSSLAEIKSGLSEGDAVVTGVNTPRTGAQTTTGGFAIPGALPGGGGAFPGGGGRNNGRNAAP